ncbi:MULTISPECIES: DUF7661 family protein [Burkholderia]|jgi:hypothetical protein|uniref:DUF7661 domain-containing protein n=3 Tax=Burkholderia contaminans TaxID=488447 RepID=A0A1E3FS24_9BURK|nr:MULTISPECIES: hypothetical protein [Burkholderia]NKE40466.1 hypothetical protein [Mycobacterium tuberculosis]UTP27168.1 hypothetical protein NMB33_40025 [Burkholderia sp. FXe9]KKL41837.1 hypothetical protein WR31_07370 [Burkholderia contaminans LMG 23361]MBA9832897.1 hypothetical protein [Burkholderia contaminans]MBA9841155.1 hypothetical protein [Burkholderia contaminans]
MNNTYRFNVFGRMVTIVREAAQWRAFDLGVDGKRRPADFQIPDFVHGHELRQYLEDLFHENATPEREGVLQMPSSGQP